MGEKLQSPVDKSAELRDKTKAFLAEAKQKGLIGVCEGSLTDVLNGIAEKAFAGAANADFMDTLNEYGAYYNDPATQDVMPFFGIEVSESEEGDIQLTFAD